MPYGSPASGEGKYPGNTELLSHQHRFIPVLETIYDLAGPLLTHITDDFFF